MRPHRAFLRISLLLAFILPTLAGIGQGTIRGFVYEKGSGEPVMFTNVVLKGETKGASTNDKGYYSITNVKAGKHTLMVTSLGYDTATAQVTVEDGDVVSQELYLEKQDIEVETVEILGNRKERQNNVKMSVQKIKPKQIQSLPSVGGEADIAQYLQVLPGVIFTGDQGGRLYIRGGSPIQNKVLLDGMVIYNPFHSIGLFSVFDTDIIRNADIYTGGFNSEYGGRISSVMDITTRDGNKERYGGKVSASPFVGKALIEGPIKRQKNKNDGWSSFILSAKNSYLDQTSKALYSPLPSIDSTGLPYRFTDIYGKVSFNGASGSKFDAFGFRHYDHVDYRNVSEIEWKTYGGGANFVIVPETSPVLLEGDFAYSQYDISMVEKEGDETAENTDRSSSIRSFNLGLDFKYFMDNDYVKYGLSVMGNRTNFQFTNFAGRNIGQQKNNTELAAYVTYKIKRGLWVIEPGIRGQYYASLATFSPEPRLGIKFNATEKLRFKAASGIYSQNLISSASQKDVVNLFYGFLTGPENLQDEFTRQDGSTREVEHSLQKAVHYILGAEYDLTRKFHINLEGYFKDFTQLTNINHNKIYPDDQAHRDEPEELKNDFILETGEAMGVDLVLKYNSENYYLWGVYSLGKVTRWDGIQQYSPVFDRRHNLNLLGSYRFGKENNWEVNARWNYGSGLPFTRTQGYYEQFGFQNGVSSNYTNGNGDLGIIYEDINQGRLPSYHRLDINVKKKWELNEHTTFQATLGVTNVYDRRNVFYYDRISRERVDQLPVLPSLGLSLDF